MATITKSTSNSSLQIPRTEPRRRSIVNIHDEVKDAPKSTYSAPVLESGFAAAEYFGLHVFSNHKLEKSVDSKTFAAYETALARNTSLGLEAAEVIAAAILKWAAELGATHYTHWFQPLSTDVPAEKHDTFLDLKRDGTPINRFEGKHLIRGEPDGSSFPSGGLRATHVARGYTAWDVSSHPFILDNGNGTTLYIPSLFYSWTGQALDDKIPLLRSIEVLGNESLKLLGELGETKHTSFKTDSGLEQEYFLIDRKYFMKRLDLQLTNRTVLGAAPPKGQEMEDQYFAASSDKVMDLIHEFEIVMWKLGVPLQTRHREVAPGQYEVAPRFADSNLATDRNILLMSQLKRVARKHGMAALLHEKPFRGVNGSGKHNNWSFGTNLVPSLLEPGETPETDGRFMLFLAATMKAVDEHSDLMRVAISGAGNDHRLGANEAPPAIVSIYLGDDIDVAVQKFLRKDTSPSDIETKVNLGVSFLPPITRASTDRNRTSTFAFTGNKFEFRAVGSSHTPSRSNQVLNTILADALRKVRGEIIEAKKGGLSNADAMVAVARANLLKHERIVFNGNGYSAEWPIEAKRRGLLNLRTTPEALAYYASEKNIKLHESLGVLTKEELLARGVVMWEEYVKKINIEGNVFVNMVSTGVVPAVIGYRAKLASVTSTGPAYVRLGQKVGASLEATLEGVEQLSAALHKLHEQGDERKSAQFAESTVLHLLQATRVHVDTLETLLPADSWPFPTYHEMLFHQD